MGIEEDIRDAWCNQGDDVSKNWLIPILLEMADRIEALERRIEDLTPGPQREA